MAFTIAVAGKGGTGKTTIAALLLRLIVENKLGACLAIDADPNSTLGEVLGVDPSTSVGQIIDSISKKPDLIPAGVAKKDFLELEIEHSLSEREGFDLLSMGRPEGPGCYCYANNLLRDVVARITKQYKFCIIDNEAGMEHLSRRTTREADYFIVISDPSSVGMHSAARIRQLSRELEFNFKKTFLFINKLVKPVSLSAELCECNFEKIYHIPFDEEILNLSLQGKPLFAASKNCKLLTKLEEFRRDYEFRAN